ncbi:MAG: phosphohydrolase, partial [Bryobacteraceae bacterium]|nr:phosphohydrolase [Bryobacteraceae bacterium]
DYGSPKTPVFPEAMLLHQLDALDSRMECMRGLLNKDRHVDGCWTGYNSTLDRSILKKQKFLDEPDTPPAPAREVAAASVPNPAVPAAKPAPRPVHSSPFGEKLIGALRKE